MNNCKKYFKYFLKEKYEAFQAFKDFKAEVEKFVSLPIKSLRTNRIYNYFLFYPYGVL